MLAVLRLLLDGREIGFIRAGRVPVVGESPIIEAPALPDLAGEYTVVKVAPRWGEQGTHTDWALALAGEPFELFETTIEVHLTPARET